MSIACIATTAHAQRDAAGVSFRSAVARCGDGQQFQRLVVAILGVQAASRSTDAGPRVEIVLEQPTRELLRGTLTVHYDVTAPVVRRTSAPIDECAVLLETLALQVAIAIDPMVALRDDSLIAPERASASSVPASSMDARASREVHSREAPSTVPLDADSQWGKPRGGIGVGALWGIVPGIGAYAELRGAMGGVHWSASSIARISLPGEERFRNGSVSIALGAVELAICHERAFASVCLGAEFAALWGSGRNYLAASTEVVPMLSPTISYAHAIRVADGVDVVPRISFGVALWRAAFEVDGVPAFRSAPVTASLSVAAIFGGE